jgi:hypothetical protein
MFRLYISAIVRLNTEQEVGTNCNTIALPLQQWLQERAAMLRYANIACLVIAFCKRVSNVMRFKSNSTMPAIKAKARCLKVSDIIFCRKLRI